MEVFLSDDTVMSMRRVHVLRFLTFIPISGSLATIMDGMATILYQTTNFGDGNGDDTVFPVAPRILRKGH